jgi:hypothetical protein
MAAAFLTEMQLLRARRLSLSIQTHGPIVRSISSRTRWAPTEDRRRPCEPGSGTTTREADRREHRLWICILCDDGPRRSDRQEVRKTVFSSNHRKASSGSSRYARDAQSTGSAGSPSKSGWSARRSRYHGDRGRFTSNSRNPTTRGPSQIRKPRAVRDGTVRNPPLGHSVAVLDPNPHDSRTISNSLEANDPPSWGLGWNTERERY